MNMKEQAEYFMRTNYPQWTVCSSSVLICPHGHRIEWDGECPDGCVSPLRQMGLI